MVQEPFRPRLHSFEQIFYRMGIIQKDYNDKAWPLEANDDMAS